jgi:hypothetical protein
MVECTKEEVETQLARALVGVADESLVFVTIRRHCLNKNLLEGHRLARAVFNDACLPLKAELDHPELCQRGYVRIPGLG